MVILDSSLISKLLSDKTTDKRIKLYNNINEDVYSQFISRKSENHCDGLLVFNNFPENISEFLDRENIKVVLVAQSVSAYQKNENNSVKNISGDIFELKAFTLGKTGFFEDEVICVPVEEELFSRIDGLYETGILADKKVAIIGLGSGGSPSAIDLIKSGVQHFVLIDHDRLEIGNVTRHICGISDLGRYKTLAVKDIMLDKNPYADIVTYEEAVSWENIDKIKTILSGMDVVICATDGRESKSIINKICLELNIVCFYAGAFRRAYGGQVLRVRPHKSLCYQCYLQMMPDYAGNIEISNEREAEKIQYSDTVVPIEPGLSIDIAPISTFVSRLAILELLRNEEHTFKSLYDDFVADFYLWINRRDVGSQFEEYEPLGYDVNNFHIMRWYGVKVDKLESCPLCGSPENWDFNV